MTPRTWIANEKLTAAKMNEIRDELNALISAVVSVAPTGAVLAYAGTTAPTNWLLCDGSAVSRTTYAALFSLIGTTYGAGDGSTTFNLPDLRGRTSIGAGTGSGLTARALAATGGAEAHALGLSEIPSHAHSYQTPTTTTNVAAGGSGVYSATSAIVSSGSAGGGGSHNNMQPFLVLNHIIKY